MSERKRKSRQKRDDVWAFGGHTQNFPSRNEEPSVAKGLLSALTPQKLLFAVYCISFNNLQALHFIWTSNFFAMDPRSLKSLSPTIALVENGLDPSKF